MKKCIQTAWLICAVLCLLGCQSHSPLARAAPDPDPEILGCRTGPESAVRTIPVEVWRGRETALSDYDTPRVCQLLEKVSRQLQAQGAMLRFEMTGPVEVHADLGRANNPSMKRTVPVKDGHLRVVIVDAIESCGGTVGYILGCTPKLGQPLVYAKRHDLFNDPAPEWVIWAHEMGHAVGLVHPDYGMASKTFADRIMTYMPKSQSQTLAHHEPAHFEQLGQMAKAGDGGSRAATGEPPIQSKPITARDLVSFVANAGQHGVPLKPLEHLDDNALLLLRVLLEPPVPSEDPLQLGLSQGVRINALVSLAELGRDEAQAFVRDYLLRHHDTASESLRRYGLWALGRGQARHPVEATRLVLQEATQASFWCKEKAPEQKQLGCQVLSEAAQDALRDNLVAYKNMPLAR